MVMLMLSPVCHLHYFCLALPLIMVLMAREWEANGAARLSSGLTMLLVVNFVANAITHLPYSDLSRDLGVAAYATVLLWLTTVVVLWRTRPSALPQSHLLPVPVPVSVEADTPLQKAG
jgi:hypothetical protein